MTTIQSNHSNSGCVSVKTQTMELEIIFWTSSKIELLPFIEKGLTFYPSGAVHGSGCGECCSHPVPLWFYDVAGHSSGSETGRRSGCARRRIQLPDHWWTYTEPHGEVLSLHLKSINEFWLILYK